MTSGVMAQKSPSHYFVNPWVDLLTAGGGLSILLFPLLLFLAAPERSPWVIEWAVVLSYVINYPHFAATVYRLYHNEENRTNYRFTAYFFPWALGALMLTAFLHPQSFGSYYVKAFLIWSGYHYSGQTLGISLIYTRRSGFPVGVKARWLLIASIYSTYLYSIIRAETYLNLEPFFGINMPSFHLPVMTAELMRWVVIISWSAFLTFAVLAPRYHEGRKLPLGVFLPPVAQLCWYLPGSTHPAFYEFVPLFHSLQYLLIAWVFQMNEQKKVYELKKEPFTLKNYWQENFRYGLWITVMGAFLFRFIPDGIAHYLPVPLNIAEPLWIATVQLHHFWTDGVIWQLRKPQVSKKLL